jgi:hypothetical protein
MCAIVGHSGATMRRQAALEGAGQEGGRKERGFEYHVQKMH